MTLSCDCYAGCWGDHSEGWPEIHDPDGVYRRAAIGLLDYGTYVTMPGNVLRIQDSDLVDRLADNVAEDSDA